MKTFKKITIGLIFLILPIAACKKEVLEVKKDKTYIQGNPPRPATPGVNTGTILTLKRNKKANITPSGDKIYPGTYIIRSRTLIVKVPILDQDFTYNIISDTTLQSDNGATLFLQK